MSVPPPPPGSVSTPSPSGAPAPAAPPLRPLPSSRWYWLAGALAALGLALVGWAVWSGVSIGRAVEAFPRVDVPGQAEVALEAGRYTVYYETQATPGAADPPDAPWSTVEVAVERVGDNEQVAVRLPLGSSTYEIGGRQGVSVRRFTIDQPGTYEVSVAADQAASEGTVAIGSGVGRGLITLLLAIFGAVGLLVTAGALAGVIALVRHLRRRQAATPI